ncbi:MAG: hypothetical protein LUC17_01255 [Oscillospiraceae bacterium]|nr:hypothetical protein [Oscillospiraceae bacterium]
MKRYIEATKRTNYNLNLDAYYDLADLLDTISDTFDELWNFYNILKDRDGKDGVIANKLSEYLAKISSDIQLAQIRYSQL